MDFFGKSPKNGRAAFGGVFIYCDINHIGRYYSIASRRLQLRVYPLSRGTQVENLHFLGEKRDGA